MRTVKLAKLLVNDKGKFHNQYIFFKLKIDYSEGHPYESILIQYGSRYDFLICGCYHYSAPEGHVYVSAVNVGSGTEILISEEEWIDTLQQLGSIEKLNEWRQIFHNKKVNK